MKKAILIFSLIVFVLVGFSANGNTQSNVSSDVKQIVLQPGDDDNSTYLAAPDGDDKKCKKCGKENCKCDKTKCDKTKSGKTCCDKTKSTKSCCDKTKSDAKKDMEEK